MESTPKVRSFGSVIQDLSGSWCIKRTGECMVEADSSVPLMHHNPDKSSITDRDLDRRIQRSKTANLRYRSYNQGNPS